VEGEAKGREAALETLAHAVLEVLEARQVAVGDDQRAAVLACADSVVLRRWVVRAATIRSADELFDADAE
jgi:hypothetical protein